MYVQFLYFYDFNKIIFTSDFTFPSLKKNELKYQHQISSIDYWYLSRQSH